MVVLLRLTFGWALCVSLASACGQPPALVRVDPVRKQTAERWRQVTGELLPIRHASIAAEEPGLVTSLGVGEGDRIEKGDTLAVLDSTLARIEVERTEAEMHAAQAAIDRRAAELARAERDLERFSELSGLDASSERELDEAQTLVLSLTAQLAEARADAAAATARHQDAERRVEKLTIVAPFSGRVIRKQTESGQWLQRGDSVVMMLSLDVIEARLNVPERFLDGIDEGQTPARIRIDALRDPDPSDPARTIVHERSAPIVSIIPDAELLSRQFPVRVLLQNRDGRIRPGMSVVGFIPSRAGEPVLSVHRDAIRRDDQGEYVFFVAEGLARTARVRTQFVLGDRVAIERGVLEAGTPVVIEGNERLVPGQVRAVRLDGERPAGAPGS